MVDERGIIAVPKEVRKFHSHRIKLVIIDLEPENLTPVDFLNSVTEKYMNIGENEPDIAEIYRQREKTDERRIMFD